MDELMSRVLEVVSEVAAVVTVARKSVVDLSDVDHMLSLVRKAVERYGPEESPFEDGASKLAEREQQRERQRYEDLEMRFAKEQEEQEEEERRLAEEEAERQRTEEEERAAEAEEEETVVEEPKGKGLWGMLRSMVSNRNLRKQAGGREGEDVGAEAAEGQSEKGGKEEKDAGREQGEPTSADDALGEAQTVEPELKDENEGEPEGGKDNPKDGAAIEGTGQQPKKRLLKNVVRRMIDDKRAEKDQSGADKFASTVKEAMTAKRGKWWGLGKKG